jgi:cell division septation protein DedD
MSVEVMKSQTAEKENSGESKSVGVPPYVTRETARVIVAPKTSGGSVTVELSGVAKKLKEALSTENKLPMRPNELSKTPVPKVASRKRAPEPRLVKAEAVNMDHYSIQVAACRRTYCVSNYTGLLKDKGFEPITKKTRNGKLILIMTGTYRTLRAAKPDLESLKERGFKKAHAIKR